MRTLLIVILLSTQTMLYGQTKLLPGWFTAVIKSKGLDKKYMMASYLKPSYLHADFNGDHTTDIAVLIIEKSTKRKGILLMHGGSNEYFIFGAGTTLSNGGNDFKWMDRWSLYHKKTASQTQFDKDSGDITGSKTIKLTRPGILVADC